MKVVEEKKEPESLKEKLFRYIQDEKYKRIILIAGIVGIALIFLSSFIPKTSTSSSEKNTASITVNMTAYKQELEQSLADIVSSIDGAGTTRVMLTMDTSAELVYATDSKDSQQISNENNGDAEQESSDTQLNYITVRLSDGTEQTVLLKEIQPKIRGVLVVCTGGENTVVYQRVLEAVTKALDISSARVCVTKLLE